MSVGGVGDHAVPVASALLNLSTSMQSLEGPRGTEYEVSEAKASGSAMPPKPRRGHMVHSHSQALTAPVLQALQQVHSLAVKAWSSLSSGSPTARNVRTDWRCSTNGLAAVHVVSPSPGCHLHADLC